ncbi:MAG: SDR family oxidoreductase [Spirochaetes bacterium]|nr:SDR family oxidoreductase [Spirochaetota bacterium]MBU1079792.1 SDR family oxidoreductase [Spirochaetota bacterium]
MSYLDTMFSYEGKTVAITGGGGVIAGAMAEAFLRAGANVALWDIKAEFAEAAGRRLAAMPGLEGAAARILPAEVDATSEPSVRAALEAAAASLGGPHVLVNAAGGNKGKSDFVEIDVPMFVDTLRLNLIAGLVVPTKVTAAYWIEKGVKGNIINMSSMSSYIPLSGVWAYGAAKAAVLNLTMACAKEFAPAGIRVNGIAPGFFVGKQNKALLFDEQTGELTRRGEDVIAHTPFGRFGDVSEIAGVSLYLASDAAAGFVTGVTVPVDGGYLVHNI